MRGFTAGVISSSGPVVRGAHAGTVLNFRISAEKLSPVDLPDSVFAPPGRYVAEMLRRLIRHAPTRDGYLVVNPRFACPVEALAAIMEGAERAPDRPDAILIEDLQGRVVAYGFKQPVRDRDALVLSALSALDASTDRSFLETAFGWSTAVVRSPFDAGGLDSNGFLLGSFDPAAAKLPAALAVEALGPLVQRFGVESARDGVLQVAVCPYHAGDILFVCQALQAEQDRPWAVLVLNEFTDIVRQALPWAEVIGVESPTPSRGVVHVTNEPAYMAELVRKARAKRAAAGGRLDGIFHLMRLHRDYSRSHFHLRDAAWFALGGDAETDAQPWPQWRAQPRHVRCTPRRRSRVILHLDGGWSLKSYPPGYRQPLLSLLRSQGFSPLVLGPPEPGLVDCDFQPFTGLPAFRALLEDSAALIGVDSFPAHYAVDFGLPTLHLFESTHPRNSQYPDSAVNSTLHEPLPCVPCGHLTVCKLDGGGVCRAAPAPHRVLAALLAICPAPASVKMPLAEGADAQLKAAVDALPQIPFPPTPRWLDQEHRQQLFATLAARCRFEEVESCVLCGSTERTVVGQKNDVPIAACGRCGLWYCARRVSSQHLAQLYDRTYWSRMMDVHQYPHAPERYSYDYAHALERVAFVREFQPAGRALDVGCGYAAFVRRLAEAGYDAAGLDMPETAAAARRSSGVRVFTQLPKDRQWDVITAFDLVEHLYQPRQTLQELERALAPGGVFIVETFRTDSRDFQAQGLNHEDVKVLEHPYMYREEHVRNLLAEIGLTTVHVVYPEGPERARFRLVAKKS